MLSQQLLLLTGRFIINLSQLVHYPKKVDICRILELLIKTLQRTLLLHNIFFVDFNGIEYIQTRIRVKFLIVGV